MARYCDACDQIASEALTTSDGYEWALCPQHAPAYKLLESVDLLGDGLHERVREQRRPGRPPCQECGGHR
jgi:hypothetical protein